MDEFYQLLLGDCLERMKEINSNSIDAIICDLPYGSTACRWDLIIPFAPLWEAYRRIYKPNAAIVLFGQEPFSSFLRISNLENYKYDWYWKKERLTNIFQVRWRPGKVTETISIFYKEQCVYNPQKTIYAGPLRTNKIKDGKLGKLIDSGEKPPIQYKDDRTRYPIDILEFKRDILTCNLHPTQKPVALMEYLIKTYTNEGDLVLDNCMGSGTIGVACANIKRQFIGIEKDESYFAIAKKRIEENYIATTVVGVENLSPVTVVS